jgi:CRP-like cAMP-binding protein
MDNLDKLSAAIWQGEVSRPFLSEWRNLAEEVKFEAGDIVVRQLHPARHLYFLVDGEIEYSLAFEGSQGDFPVGGIALRFSPLGWSGFSAPFRYATSARAKSACTLYRWPIDALNQLFYLDLAMGRRFFHYILSMVLPLLADARRKLKTSTGSSKLFLNTLAKRIPGSPCASLTPAEIREILGHSLFLEVFPESYLTPLGDMVAVRHFRQGEQLYQQGSPSDQLILLAAGLVAVSFTPDDSDREVFLRSCSSSGQIIATSAFSLTDKHVETATAVTAVTVLSINMSAIQCLTESQPELGLILARRLLWLLTFRLRTLRIQMVGQHHDEEHIVIRNLLSQVSPQLGISSKLYKLPHLLASRLTHAEALTCLQDVKQNGSRLERTLASVCIELLAELWRELEFYEGLHEVYQTVTQAPVEKAPEYVRHLSCQAFKRVFESARYVIRGVEHLPARPGNIFILNHLISHPYHALANGFEFSLDTHFVSAMILEPQYGDSGVRVVRRGRGGEHGHHSYYDRLGHIYVYTSESDALLESEQELKARRESFNKTAGDYLRAGVNLIICPEGTANWSEDSPSAFKKGAFRLAAGLDPEPLIVPIAVTNFDKRLKNSAFAAVVHEPFYLTDKCDPYDETSLNNFLVDLQAKVLADDAVEAD